jgi:hypothetical protein
LSHHLRRPTMKEVKARLMCMLMAISQYIYIYCMIYIYIYILYDIYILWYIYIIYIIHIKTGVSDPVSPNISLGEKSHAHQVGGSSRSSTPAKAKRWLR